MGGIQAPASTTGQTATLIAEVRGCPRREVHRNLLTLWKRLPFLCCWTLASLLCEQTFPNELESGSMVVQVHPDLGLRPSKDGQPLSSIEVANLYRVIRVEADWVFLVDEWKTISGWARVDEVVPLRDPAHHFTDKIAGDPRSVFNYFMRAKVYRQPGKA